MKYLVNLTRMLQVVDIIVEENGKKTKQALTIYERAKIPLKSNTTVCTNWMVRNPKTVRVIEDKAKVVPTTNGEKDGNTSTKSK